MDIKSKFLELTKLTYIYGTESLLESHLPSGFSKDKFGNYFYKIGNSQTMFTCHLDTATDKVQKVKHEIKENIISTNGSTILGADDKAGMTILLYMIEKNVPGLYYFFIGEEVGCIGSNAASILDFSNYKRCISFDRRGYSSIITHQLGQRCCSDKFANELCELLFQKQQLVYNPDPTGVVTDSAMFTSQIQECTNISVGYFNEHSTKEYQDILFLKKLSQACVEINWESLSCERELWCNDYTSSRWGPADEELHESNSKKSAKIKIKLNDSEYLVNIKNQRLKREKIYIENWIARSGTYGQDDIEWDGDSCYLLFTKSKSYKYQELLGTREELMYVVDELCNITVQDLNILEKLS